jgi:SAM-dependent methyltransferase
VKGARKALQVLLRPWLAAQTIFNRETAGLFGGMAASVADLQRRMPHFESGMHSLESRIQRLETSRADMASRATPFEAGSAASSDRIVHLFVHSRLPRPPGRVLVSGLTSQALAGEMASFGFEVWVLGLERGAAPQARVHACDAVEGALPFPAANFDAVVALMRSQDAPPSPPGMDEEAIRELLRVLRPAGTLLVALSSGGVTSNERVSRALSPHTVRVAEAVVALHEGDSWNVVPADPDGWRSTTPIAGAISLVAAVRTDAPDR